MQHFIEKHLLLFKFHHGDFKKKYNAINLLILKILHTNFELTTNIIQHYIYTVKNIVLKHK